EALLDLVDPEHRRRDRLGDLRRLAHRRLRAVAPACEGRGEVEAQQREAPLARDCLRTQRLAAALHTEQQQPAWRRQTEASRLLAEGTPALGEPGLQLAEPADVAETRVA